MFSMLIFGIIMTGALSFLSLQNEGFRKGMDRMSSLQTLRYVLGSLETGVQTAGTNMVSGQPELVVADEGVLAFNADYASNIENDFFAVYYDPDAPAGQVTALRTAVTIPLTSFQYPDTAYTTAGGTRAPAELLIFYFTPDTSTSRTDDFALYRQVNDADPEVVARNFLRTESEPFFRYFRDSDVALDSIPDSSLPLYHSAAIHLGAADTGQAALIDSIRAVRISVTATNGKEGELERTAQLTRIIRMPNVGFGTLEMCGGPPILGTAIAADVVDLGGGEYAVNLGWGQAVDEAAGEQDVVRYVIYRRAPQDGWG
ncbi:MAG: hypothetical protein KAJ42_13900, partial [Gemmatimonadetes bacterium]|nr:hypothetical protein [Gemmatimonadota bacterium]